MALILEHGIFYHIPKTGGVWVGEALKRSGLVKTDYGEVLSGKNSKMRELGLFNEHVSPSYADSEVVMEKPSFAFIRNPITWYQSIWKYKFPVWDAPYTEYRSDNFNGFMRKIMDMSPGFLTKIYKEFDGVTYMGRQENLSEDLASILEILGERVDYDFLINLPATNVSVMTPCDYEPEILEELKEKEKWIFEKYYKEEI